MYTDYNKLTNDPEIYMSDVKVAYSHCNYELFESFFKMMAT